MFGPIDGKTAAGVADPSLSPAASSLDDAIRMLVSSDHESDEVLFWLQKCSQQLLDQPVSPTDHQSGLSEGAAGPGTKRREPVLTEQELADIRHLITFDHLYNKSLPSPSPSSDSHSDVELTHVFADDNASAYEQMHDETILSLFPELA